ncbi:MAG TPA: DUF5683 domain-containing protein [Chitinophagaceae bacterium]|nr:DUF5683 domain-containing protein [Chitinophagaceae bacterium]
MKYTRAALLFLLILFSKAMFAQQPDSPRVQKDTSLFAKGLLDTIPNRQDTAKPRHSPRKAAIRSAILPGWGQAYNKKYWKIPIVYTAIGIPAYLFLDNLKWYRRTKYAYLVVSTNSTNTDSLNRVHPELRPFVDRGFGNELLNYRNEFRRNVDYSALFFLLFWGLNIVDASVDAHLKDFNVTPDLSLKIKPGYSPTGNTYGLSLVFDIHDGKPKLKSLGH